MLIAGLTGMRVSEVLSLRSGCLSTLALADGRRLLLVNGTVFKTAQDARGEKADWVAGWDLPENRVRLAIEALHRIQETCRSNRGPQFCALSCIRSSVRRSGRVGRGRCKQTSQRFAGFLWHRGVSDRESSVSEDICALRRAVGSRFHLRPDA